MARFFTTADGVYSINLDQVVAVSFVTLRARQSLVRSGEVVAQEGDAAVIVRLADQLREYLTLDEYARLCETYPEFPRNDATGASAARKPAFGTVCKGVER